MTTYLSEEINLDYHYFLKFTGWTSATYEKRTTRDRINKLKNMGAYDIHVTGTGTKAKFSLKLAPMFWPVFLAYCQGVQYNEVAEAYLRKLISVGTIEETRDGPIALFSSEVYQDITSHLNNSEHDPDFTYQGVKTKCDRIRTKFKNVGYFTPKDSHLTKTHRVKVNGGWLRGHKAHTASEQVIEKWREFFKELENRYLEKYTETNVVPPKIKGKAAKDFQLNQLPLALGIQHSRPCVEKRLDAVFFEDLRFAQERFQQTNDLQFVKAAIIERQNTRYEEIKRQWESDKQHKEEQSAYQNQPISNLSDVEINAVIAGLYTDSSSMTEYLLNNYSYCDILDGLPWENETLGP